MLQYPQQIHLFAFGRPTRFYNFPRIPFKGADTLHARTSSQEQKHPLSSGWSSGWCVVAGQISAHPPQQLREPIADLKEAGVDVGVECVPESGCETKS